MLPVGSVAPHGHPVLHLANTGLGSLKTVALEPNWSSAQQAEAGVAAIDEAIDEGCDLLVLPGILPGATTSTLVALLLRLSAIEVVGESPHLDDARWADHVAAIRDRTHDARRHEDDPVALLHALGSPELVALVAMLLRAAGRRTPVLLDGPADLAAALCASRLAILGSWWWFAAAGLERPGHDAGHRGARSGAAGRAGLAAGRRRGGTDRPPAATGRSAARRGRGWRCGQGWRCGLRYGRVEQVSDNSPPRPANAVTPRTVPRGASPTPMPVQVRLVWPDGREEWAAAVATRWNREHVLVEIPARAPVAVWVSAVDVRRNPA